MIIIIPLCCTAPLTHTDESTLCVSVPSDPYQILGPTSSRLANPGKGILALCP